MGERFAIEDRKYTVLSEILIANNYSLILHSDAIYFRPYSTVGWDS
jgi:hypothetical protein